MDHSLPHAPIVPSTHSDDETGAGLGIVVEGVKYICHMRCDSSSSDPDLPRVLTARFIISLEIIIGIEHFELAKGETHVGGIHRNVIKSLGEGTKGFEFCSLSHCKWRRLASVVSVSHI